MSIKAIDWATERPIDSHGAKLLLVLIANYANEQGYAWPGQETLARQTRATRKSIIRWLAELERDGYLTRFRRGGDGSGRRSNLYRLNLEQCPPDDTLPGRLSPPADTLGNVPLTTQAKSPSGPSNVPLVTQDPSEEPSVKPSERDARASDAPSPAQQKQKRATRLEVTELPEDWQGYCQRKRPDLDPAETFEDFRDYWSAQPGQRGCKLDWCATWRRWVRHQQPQQRPAAVPSRRPSGTAMRPGALSDAHLRAAARPGESWDEVRRRLLRERL
jgi:hypothetical protein